MADAQALAQTETTLEPVRHQYNLEVGDEFGVFEHSDQEVTFDPDTNEAHFPPVKLIARVAIIGRKPGISGIGRHGSFDTGGLIGEWRGVDGKDESVAVVVRSDEQTGISTAAIEGGDEARLRCRIMGHNLVFKFVNGPRPS